MANVVKLNPEYFPNPDRGRPIGSGDVYVGKPDTDPEVPANQKQASVQQEDGSVVNVSQPITLSAGGVPEHNGSPVTILVEGDYSLKVLNSLGSQIYYVPSDLSLINQSFLSGWSCDLASAVTAIGATETTLIVDCVATLADGVTVTIPSTMTLQYVRGGLIQGTAGGATETLVVNGGFICEGGQQGIGSNIATNFAGVKNPVNAESFSTLELAQESDAPHLRINKSTWSISATVTFDQNNQIVEFVGPGKVSTTDDTLDGFAFTGNHAKIINPFMQGPGTFVQDDSTDAALIYISGDYAEVYGGYLIDPPTAGIFVEGGDYANLHHMRIDGGISARTGTFHFGIKVDDSVGSKANNNIIWDCVQGIKGTTGGLQTHFEAGNNYIRNCFDHAVYGGGNYENFHHNQIYHAQAGAGTAIIGQDSYGQYCNNEIYTIVSGITIRDPLNSKVHDNIIIIDSTSNAIGIKLDRITNGDILSNSVKGNTIDFISTGSSDGISLISTGAGTVTGFNNVEGNIIKNSTLGSGNAAIFIDSVAEGEQNHINNNIIDSPGADGIELQFMKNGTIIGNTIKDADSRCMHLLDVAYTTVALNTLLDEAGGVTAAGILEADNDDVCHDNQYIHNIFNLSGLATTSVFNTTSTDFTFSPTQAGRTWSLTGNASVSVVDGNVHFVAIDQDGRNFNPNADWPIGAQITVTNTSAGAFGINFDSGGINQTIAQNETGIFSYSGTAWNTDNIY
jgi:parallel beta-helix repeat protein